MTNNPTTSTAPEEKTSAPATAGEFLQLRQARFVEIKQCTDYFSALGTAFDHLRSKVAAAQTSRYISYHLDKVPNFSSSENEEQGEEAKEDVKSILFVCGGHGQLTKPFLFERDATFWKKTVIEPFRQLGIRFGVILLDSCFTASHIRMFVPLLMQDGEDKAAGGGVIIAHGSCSIAALTANLFEALSCPSSLSSSSSSQEEKEEKEKEPAETHLAAKPNKKVLLLDAAASALDALHRMYLTEFVKSGVQPHKETDEIIARLVDELPPAAGVASDNDDADDVAARHEAERRKRVETLLQLHVRLVECRDQRVLSRDLPETTWSARLKKKWEDLLDFIHSHGTELAGLWNQQQQQQKQSREDANPDSIDVCGDEQLDRLRRHLRDVEDDLLALLERHRNEKQESDLAAERDLSAANLAQQQAEQDEKEKAKQKDPSRDVEEEQQRQQKVAFFVGERVDKRTEAQKQLDAQHEKESKALELHLDRASNQIEDLIWSSPLHHKKNNDNEDCGIIMTLRQALQVIESRDPMTSLVLYDHRNRKLFREKIVTEGAGNLMSFGTHSVRENHETCDIACGFDVEEMRVSLSAIDFRRKLLELLRTNLR